MCALNVGKVKTKRALSSTVVPSAEMNGANPVAGTTVSVQDGRAETKQSSFITLSVRQRLHIRYAWMGEHWRSIFLGGGE